METADSRPITVALDVPAPHRVAATWALECLLAPLSRPWCLVASGTTADVGYGCAGAAFELACDHGAWEQLGAMPPADDDLALAFWWLARVEELHAGPAAHDRHGRFRYAESWLARSQARDDRYVAPVDAIVLRLAEALGDGRAAPWPGGRTCAVALTHDIDLPWRWTRSGVRRTLAGGRAAVRERRPARALKLAAELATMPTWRLRDGDPWNNADAIGRLEAAYDARSTSYVIAGHHDPRDGDESTYRAAIGAYLHGVEQTGGEIGLHGSYTTSTTPGRLAQERAWLEQRTGRTVLDHRYHFLRHVPAVAWPELEEAGLGSDASLGFAERPGLRSGFSWPYRAWCHAGACPLDLVVVPLALMDATLEPRYLDASRAEAAEWVDDLVAVAAARGSGVSVLWHNDKLCNLAAGRYHRLYERLLRQSHDADAWLASTGDVVGEWRRRLALAPSRAQLAAAASPAG